MNRMYETNTKNISEAAKDNSIVADIGFRYKIRSNKLDFYSVVERGITILKQKAKNKNVDMTNKNIVVVHNNASIKDGFCLFLTANKTGQAIHWFD